MEKEPKKGMMTWESAASVVKSLPPALFRLPTEIYLGRCCDLFEVFYVNRDTRRQPPSERLEKLRRANCQPDLIGRLMTKPEDDQNIIPMDDGVTQALRHLFQRHLTSTLFNRKGAVVFDLALVSFTTNGTDNYLYCDPATYHQVPCQRPVFGGHYVQGYVRYEDMKVAGISDNLLPWLRDWVAYEDAALQAAGFSWHDVFTDAFYDQVFSNFQLSLLYGEPEKPKVLVSKDGR